MEIFFMFLIAFGIVGSVEARVRSILKTHEKQLELLLKQAYPFSLKSKISLAQQPPGGAGAVENSRYNLQT